MVLTTLPFVLGCLLLQVEASDIQLIKSGLALPPQVETLDNVFTSFFSQILDHYSSNATYWQQKYYMNSKLWKGGNSPVFLMIGGEGPTSANWMSGGAWYEWGAQHGALLFQLEHRFYGESRPTTDTSAENIKYLRSQQALGDIAYFIDSMNTAYNLTSANRWILFGGSYPGNLVAWARLKYPDLVYGAISSSGPLRAEADFYQYNEVVQSVLNYHSKGCGDQISQGLQDVQKLLTTWTGVSTLKKKFSICSGFDANILNDRRTLMQTLTIPATGAVQYNGQNKLGVDKVCEIMNNQSVPQAIDRLAMLYKNFSKDCVYASYSGSVAYYQGSSWDDGAVQRSARQWLFQTCNEFGYYQTSNNKTSLASDSLPLSYFTQMCTDIFGDNYNGESLAKAVEYTNNFYGGTDAQVSRVVYIQGSEDPWHKLGIVKKTTNDSRFLLIQGTSHCYDMLASQDDDPPSLKSAKKTAGQYISYWLSL